MTAERDDFEACEVCGRTILRGERATHYVDPEGKRILVCVLCKPRAEASGWVPEALAETISRPEPVSRRARIGSGLRQRLGRRGEAGAAKAPSDATDQEPVPSALEVFNASREPRKVAGLVRSLGEPRVTVREQRDGTVVVVAWDLSWYRWQVSGDQVSELARGNEISELPLDDREWNATAAEDGTIAVES